MKLLGLAFLFALIAASTCSALLWIQPSRFAAPGGGGGGFDPSTYGTPILWLKADAISGSDGDAVGTWPFSTYGSDATQATAGLKPLLKTGIVNGKPVVRFDGSDDKLETSSTISTTSATSTFFVVAKYNSSTFATYAGLLFQGSGDGNTWLCGNSGGTGFYPFGGVSGLYKNGIATTYTDSGAGPMNAWAVYCGTIVSGATHYLQIGNHPGGAGRVWNGDIAEIIVYSDSLSTGNRQSVEDYLGTKYGITITH